MFSGICKHCQKEYRGNGKLYGVTVCRNHHPRVRSKEDEMVTVFRSELMTRYGFTYEI